MVWETESLSVMVSVCVSELVLRSTEPVSVTVKSFDSDMESERVCVSVAETVCVFSSCEEERVIE